jgi:acetoin utilization deacetylase AcuC-like enzyme
MHLGQNTLTTAYITHPHFVQHTIDGHPEFAGRVQAIWRELDAAGLSTRMQSLVAQPITTDLLLNVHSRHYLDTLQWITESHRGMVMLEPSTYFGPDSLETARLAAGGVVQAVDEVLSGRADNTLAVVRPPGHHAVQDQAMGFCIFGNVALATKFAQQTHHLERILIVDFDVHHGNGTQDMLYDDPKTLFISTHQYPFYPGTGALHDTGTGSGKGCTINIPLQAGHGDRSYAAIFQDIIWPAAERYKPQFILVSAGFDAHWDDPLANMRLSLTGYAHLTHELMRMADTYCDGKIAFVLEGGYNLQALAHGVRNTAHALLGDNDISDPLGPAPGWPEPSINSLIAEVRRIHAL